MQKLQKLLLSSVFALLMGCSMELSREEYPQDPTLPQGPDLNGEQVDTHITLLLPYGFGVVTTRTLSAEQESTIQEACVLLFDTSDVLKNVIDAESVTIESGSPAGEALLNVTLPRGVYKLVVLVNSADIIRSAQIAGGQTYDKVAESLVGSVTGKMYQSPDSRIPMWGEADDVNVNGPASCGTILLTRAVARVDVGVGTYDEQTASWNGLDSRQQPIPFTLKEVYVMRPGSHFSVVRATDSGTPSVPQVAAKFTPEESRQNFAYTATENFIARTIYVPEADIHITPTATPGDENHTERMALVVGGVFTGENPSNRSVTYYRVEFCAGTSLVDVLRNYLYRFSISSVSGSGASSPLIAYQSLSSNITAGILDWTEEGFADIRFIGDKYFAVSENPLVVGPLAGARKQLKIRTNVSGLTGVPSSNGYFSYTLSGPVDNTYTLEVEAVSSNISSQGADRVDNWIIDAGGLLKFPLVVRQSWVPSDPTLHAVGLTSSPSQGGSVVSDHPSASVGSEVSVLASPSVDYAFSGWSTSGVLPAGFTLASALINGSSLSDPRITFRMPAGPVNLVANFTSVPTQYTITTSAYPAIEGTAMADEKIATAGTRVNLMAAAKRNAPFLRWVVTTASGGAASVGLTNPNSLTGAYFTMPNYAVRVRAEFTPLYSVSVSSNSGANVILSPSGPQLAGTVITATAGTWQGVAFVRWSFSRDIVLTEGWFMSETIKFRMPANDTSTITSLYIGEFEFQDWAYASGNGRDVLWRSANAIEGGGIDDTPLMYGSQNPQDSYNICGDWWYLPSPEDFQHLIDTAEGTAWRTGIEVHYGPVDGLMVLTSEGSCLFFPQGEYWTNQYSYGYGYTATLRSNGTFFIEDNDPRNRYFVRCVQYI